MSAPDLPLVSIVVPVRNGQRYLRDSLDSILAQDYPHTEVIVMDDASTDGTAAIAYSYGSRIVVQRQPEQRGQFGNVNDGIARAKGDLVAVYHADDVYRPELVSREVEYLAEHPQVAAVFSRDVFIDERGVAFAVNELPPEVAGSRPLDYATVINALLTHKNVFLRCPSSMVRASIYREVGRYSADYGIAGDLEMWLRIARRHAVGVIDEALFSYRSGHGSVSDDYFQLRVEPETYFELMDRELRGPAAGVATAEALTAYEAHRAEDDLMRAIGNYVLDRRAESRAILRAIPARALVRSGRVQRSRLLVLLALMRVLVTIPRAEAAADVLRKRMFGRWAHRSATHPSPG